LGEIVVKDVLKIFRKSRVKTERGEGAPQKNPKYPDSGLDFLTASSPALTIGLTYFSW
jgi:hypothetical protein